MANKTGQKNTNKNEHHTPWATIRKTLLTSERNKEKQKKEKNKRKMKEIQKKIKRKTKEKHKNNNKKKTKRKTNGMERPRTPRMAAAPSGPLGTAKSWRCFLLFHFEPRESAFRRARACLLRPFHAGGLRQWLALVLGQLPDRSADAACNSVRFKAPAAFELGVLEVQGQWSAWSEEALGARNFKCVKMSHPQHYEATSGRKRHCTLLL